jgi:hypothetical protein
MRTYSGIKKETEKDYGNLRSIRFVIFAPHFFKTIDMDNMTYEFFIRKAMNCKRFEHGANTDTFNNLNMQYHLMKEDGKEEKRYEKDLKEVKGYLFKACDRIANVLQKKGHYTDHVDDILDIRSTIEKARTPQEIFDAINNFDVINKYDYFEPK